MSNKGCDMSKYTDEENMMQYKALPHEINYVINTNDYCHHMKLQENLNGSCKISVYGDSKYVVDNDAHKRLI